MSDIIVKQHIDDLLVTDTLPEAQDVLGIPRHPLTAYWTSTYTTVCSNSADWGLGYNSYTAVAANSANWDSGGGLYSAVVTNSANWDLGYAGYQVVASNNENWDKGYRAYTAVSPNSANWNLGYTGYAAVASTSGTWNSGLLSAFTAYKGLCAYTIRERLANVVNVKDFGAKGDGVTNDTLALQRAIYAASFGGQDPNFNPMPSVITYNDLVTITKTGEWQKKTYQVPRIIYGGPGIKPVYIPSGTYLIDRPLIYATGHHIYGDGQTTVITLSTEASCPHFMTLNLWEITNHPEIFEAIDEWASSCYLHDFNIRSISNLRDTTKLMGTFTIKAVLTGVAGSEFLRISGGAPPGLNNSGRGSLATWELPIKLTHEDTIYTVLSSSLRDIRISPPLVTSTPTIGARAQMLTQAFKGIFANGGETSVIERIRINLGRRSAAFLDPNSPTGVGIHIFRGSPGPVIKDCMVNSCSAAYWIDNSPVSIHVPSGDNNRTFIRAGVTAYSVVSIFGMKCESNCGYVLDVGAHGGGAVTDQYSIFDGSVNSSTPNIEPNKAVINVRGGGNRYLTPKITTINFRPITTSTNWLWQMEKFINPNLTTNPVRVIPFSDYADPDGVNPVGYPPTMFQFEYAADQQKRFKDVYTAVVPNSAGFTGWHNVKMYGARGNGTTNDYHSIMTAFQRVTANGGTVYFPAGNYRIQEGIRLNFSTKPITILGDGDSSIITAASALSTINDPSSTTANALMFHNGSNVTIRDIKLFGNGGIQPIPTGDGVPVERGGRILLNNKAKHRTLRFDYSKNILIDNVTFDNSQIGSASFFGCSSVQLLNSRFTTQTYRWPLTGTLGRFTGEYYPDAPSTQIYAGGGSHVEFVGGTALAPRDFTCRNCYFRDWQYDAISFGANAAAYPTRNVEVSDCTFENISSSVFAIEAVHSGTTTGLSSLFANQTYTRNKFINSKYSPFEGGTGISVTGNGVTVSENVWVDESPYSTFDTWRRGCELDGANITVTNNEFENSQIHYNNNHTPAISASNLVISNNIMRSRLSVTSSGLGMIFLKDNGKFDVPINNFLITNNILSYSIPSNQRMISCAGNNYDGIISNNIFRSPFDNAGVGANGSAISLQNNSSACNITITNNVIEGLSFGISLPTPNDNNFRRNIIVKNNTINTSPVLYKSQGSDIIANYSNKNIAASGDNTNTLLLTSQYAIRPGQVFASGTASDARPYTIVNNINSINNIVGSTVLCAFDATVTTPMPWSNSNNRFLEWTNIPIGDVIIADNISKSSPSTSKNYLSSQGGIRTESFAKWNMCELSQLVTLSSTIIDTQIPLLPANSIIKSVVVRTIVEPGAVETYSIGTPTNPTRFATSANIHLTAGIGPVGGRFGRRVCLDHWPLSSSQIIPESIRFTLDKSPTKWGSVRVTTFFENFEAPGI